MNSTIANANIEFHCEDVLEHIKTVHSCSIHTTFADPPYFLGSEWHYVEGTLQELAKAKPIEQTKLF